RSLGLRELAGKPLYMKSAGTGAAGEVTASRVDLASDFDHMVSGDATSIAGQQRNPTVAVNPFDQNIVVVIAENDASITGNATDCSVYLSFDGGVSYGYSYDLPFLTVAPHRCASPKAIFSPDGTHLYVAYLDIAGTNTTVVVRTYPGFDPAGAPLSSTSVGGAVFDSLSLGVHAGDLSSPGVSQAYLAFSGLFVPSTCNMYLLRMTNFISGIGLTTPPPPTTCAGLPPLSERVLAGPTVAGGPGAQVLACWFDSGKDGYSTPVQTIPPVPPTPVAPLNKFNIACRSS